MSIAENLVRLRTGAKLSQSALAKMAGVSQQLISQLESGDNTTTKHLPKIAGTLGVGVADLDPSYGTAPADEVRKVKIVGFVQAGEFAEAWQWEQDDIYEMPIPADEKFRGYSLLGVETKGTSMNKRYPEGTVLIYTNAIDTREDLKPGKRYVIERHKPDGTIEATVKLLWLDNAGKAWLLPESTDPLFQQPIPLAGLDGETIQIVGRVRYAITREP